jgi:transcription termination factor Rho
MRRLRRPSGKVLSGGDINKSGTRKEELLLPKVPSVDERVVW